MTIPEIFAAHGEPYFRAGEARVIARLLEGGPQVLATGGGAFMNRGHPRGASAPRAISVWLRATLEVLSRRIKRRTDRPLLTTADPVATLQAADGRALSGLCRRPISRCESREVPHDTIVDEIVAGLRGRIPARPTPRTSMTQERAS